MKILLMVLLAVLSLALIICGVMLHLCNKGGDSKLYCFIFNHDEWIGWEAVVKDFDNVEFEGYYTYEENPALDCYAFNLSMPDGSKCNMNYWTKTNSVSVHDYPGSENCLCTFDKYHQKVVKGLLYDKFDFMREVIDR